MPLISVDLSPLPTAKRRAALSRRQVRLRQLQDSVNRAMDVFDLATVERGGLKSDLRIRDGFAYLQQPAPAGSDRQVPLRADRPPATRIASSRGAALRLELTALGMAQARHRPGKKVRNRLPLRPQRTDLRPHGWVDLIASPSKRADGAGSVSVEDKKVRQVQNALDSLREAGLVRLPQGGATNDIYENFELLDERGSQAGASLEYQVPTDKEAIFRLPSTFITNGWVHVLEDSEISVLLMVACRRGANPGEEDVAIEGNLRLLQYGISRDAFSAHEMLQKLGLLEVDKINRRGDGRAEGFKTDGAHLHRLSLRPEGFEENGFEKLTSTIEYELSRVV